MADIIPHADITLAQLRDRPVVDSAGAPLGRLKDLVILFQGIFPRVTKVLVTRPQDADLLVGWDQVAGLDPAPGTTPRLGLRPAMTVRARLVMSKAIRAGDGVSYGHTWHAAEDTTVGEDTIGTTTTGDCPEVELVGTWLSEGENVAPLLVQSTLQIASAVLSAAALGFLGLGAQPPTPEWGTMLSKGRDFLRVAPHITAFPGLAIMLIVLGFNLLGDGLRDALDPRLKAASP